MGMPLMTIVGAQLNLHRVVSVCLDGNQRCAQLTFTVRAGTPPSAPMTPPAPLYFCASTDPWIDCDVEDDGSLVLGLGGMTMKDAGGMSVQATATGGGLPDTHATGTMTYSPRGDIDTCCDTAGATLHVATTS